MASSRRKQERERQPAIYFEFPANARDELKALLLLLERKTLKEAMAELAWQKLGELRQRNRREGRASETSPESRPLSLEERRALAQRARTLRHQGYSLSAIARLFAQEGIRTISGLPATQWEHSGVKRILRELRE